MITPSTKHRLLIVIEVTQLENHREHVHCVISLHENCQTVLKIEEKNVNF